MSVENQGVIHREEDSVLVCPKCGATSMTLGLRDGIVAELACPSCSASFERDQRDRFFHFYDQPVSQTRSLLVHQDEKVSRGQQRLVRFGVAKTVPAIRDALQRAQSDVVLDVGCGSGGYAITFSDLYGRYYGIEPSKIPQERMLDRDLPERVVLVHNNPEAPLPIQDESIDIVMFLASYDHIPDRNTLIQEVWRKMRPGGHLLITMTNYAFWPKRALRWLAGRPVFTNDFEHYCVHSPGTLTAELRSIVGTAEVTSVDSDSVFVPNLPAWISGIYRSPFVIEFLNACARIACTKVLRLRNSGSVMTVVFRKPV